MSQECREKGLWKPGGPRYRPRQVFAAEGRTIQAHRDQCDINLILKKFQEAGVKPEMDVNQQFADVSNMGDFRVAMNRIVEGQRTFDALDPQVRARFGNDAASFFKFAEDPKNREEVIELRFGKEFAKKWIRSEALKKRAAEIRKAKEDELLVPKPPAPPASPEPPKAP